MIEPDLVAFIATPGIDEAVSASPAWISPFIVETRTGTRPVRAIGTPLLPTPPLPQITRAGFVETTQSMFLPVPSDFLTPLESDTSIITRSPATRSSFVG